MAAAASAPTSASKAATAQPLVRPFSINAVKGHETTFKDLTAEIAEMKSHEESLKAKQPQSVTLDACTQLYKRAKDTKKAADLLFARIDAAIKDCPQPPQEGSADAETLKALRNVKPLEDHTAQFAIFSNLLASAIYNYLNERNQTSILQTVFWSATKTNWLVDQYNTYRNIERVKEAAAKSVEPKADLSAATTATASASATAASATATVAKDQKSKDTTPTETTKALQDTAKATGDDSGKKPNRRARRDAQFGPRGAATATAAPSAAAKPEAPTKSTPAKAADAKPPAAVKSTPVSQAAAKPSEPAPSNAEANAGAKPAAAEPTQAPTPPAAPSTQSPASEAAAATPSTTAKDQKTGEGKPPLVINAVSIVATDTTDLTAKPLAGAAAAAAVATVATAPQTATPRPWFKDTRAWISSAYTYYIGGGGQEKTGGSGAGAPGPVSGPAPTPTTATTPPQAPPPQATAAAQDATLLGILVEAASQAQATSPSTESLLTSIDHVQAQVDAAAAAPIPQTGVAQNGAGTSMDSLLSDAGNGAQEVHFDVANHASTSLDKLVHPQPAAAQAPSSVESLPPPPPADEES